MKQLWYGGKIYTMEKENETVEAVLVEDDKIIAVGTLHELSVQADEKVDLQGAVMYPGFVDSHLHMIFQGEKLIRLDLTKAASAEEMLEMVKEAAKTTPSDQWLFGEGWNENNFADQRIPTKEELDAIRKEPILLTRICHHMILGNTAALEAGGIFENSESPAGGEIGRNAEGRLNGLLYDLAMNAVTDAIPKEGEAYIESLTDSLNLAIDDMLSYGLTGGHTEDMHYFGKFTNPLTAYHRVVGEKHHFRVTLLRHNAVFEEMMEANAKFDEPFIEPGAMKIFADGALGGSTAALSKPYSDQPDNQGLFIQTDEELEELVKLARKYDEPVAVHMIGDAGVEQALNVLEKYPLTSGKRDRLIHCCVLREDLVERMEKLPVVLDIQPAFVPSDFPWAINRLGEDRLDWAYPWKKLINRGLMCAAGTDAPIEDINPLTSIYAAVERKKPYADHEGYIPEEKLSRFQAVQLYTIGSAKAICKEHERGYIKPGYVADFSIFDRDLFDGTSEDMLTAKAVKTVVAGRTVFDRAKV
ncbi:amidohydrolase [Peribacillus asahii]|uniref:Amidohydrolase n=1 Tax=Peribacillus asahii TaxID=228899 RepID=A0A3T0KRY6_9BACI|nr:amidohydrolase [Peribacillus asahii]AZV43048.1 amidohydrolase [Peribacillus asahii]USK83167.1 amidohydrolase [Peribacillus asahii]